MGYCDGCYIRGRVGIRLTKAPTNHSCISLTEVYWRFFGSLWDFEAMHVCFVVVSFASPYKGWGFAVVLLP